jgi:hypothetical protein
MRIGLIICNALIVKFGVRPVKGVLPYVAVGGLITLGFLAYRAQKKLWQADMAAKQASEQS